MFAQIQGAPVPQDQLAGVLRSQVRLPHPVFPSDKSRAAVLYNDVTVNAKDANAGWACAVRSSPGSQGTILATAKLQNEQTIPTAPTGVGCEKVIGAFPRY